MTDPISAGVGLISMIAGQQQANDQKKMQKKGLKMAERKDEAVLRNMDKQWELAEGYDPSQETRIAVKAAEDSAQRTFGQQLKGLVSNFAKGGAMPGLSSEWNVKLRGAAERSYDPLKEFVANRESSNFQRKMNAYSQAAGAIPGQLGDEYFRYAETMPSGNLGGSLQMLLQGMKGFKGGGGGGSGDYRVGLDGAYGPPTAAVSG